MTNPPHPDRKIIVDEDWKSQVEAEREAMRHTPPAASDTASDTASATPHEDAPLPPAEFAGLVNQLAVSAMMALGQIKESEDAKPEVHFGLAKYHIDMLEVLQQKTHGNLDPPESRMLDDLLYQLRLVFVQVNQAAGNRQIGS